MTSRGRKDSYEMCQRLDRAARGRLAEKQSRRRRDDEAARPCRPSRTAARSRSRAGPKLHSTRPSLHKRPLLTHMQRTVIGRGARGLVVAFQARRCPKGAIELNTAGT